jgi:lipopolysaccharide export system protein LptC
VTASLEERTALTTRFNQEVQEHCDKRGYTFFDLDSVSFDEHGVLKSKLMNEDPFDHHCAAKAYCKLLLLFVRQYLNQKKSLK